MRSVLAAVLASFSHIRHNRLPSGQSLSRRSVRSAILASLAAIAVLCPQLGAQVRFGGVVGTVSDSTGAIVSGASVKVTNLGTNETRTIQTGSAGTFAFPNLIAGMYRTEVEMTGFKKFIRD